MVQPLELELAVFVGGIWAATKSMLDASLFVNNLRDTVVTGVKDGITLSLAHRSVLRTHWLLTMAGTIGFQWVISALLFVVACRSNAVVVHSVLFIIAFVPLVGSLLFALCGRCDWRLMKTCLKLPKTEREVA